MSGYFRLSMLSSGNNLFQARSI